MAEFDMGLVQRGARNRRTPYYEATQRTARSATPSTTTCTSRSGSTRSRTSINALLNDVTLWDVAVERCLEISGPDGFPFAQLLTPRDLSKCAVGQAKYVLISTATAASSTTPS